MGNYNTSRQPMSLAEFEARAAWKGWRPCSQSTLGEGDVVLVNDLGDVVVAYVEKTALLDHVGVRGDSHGLLALWEEGSDEQRFLCGGGEIENLDRAIRNVVRYY